MINHINDASILEHLLENSGITRGLLEDHSKIIFKRNIKPTQVCHQMPLMMMELTDAIVMIA